MTTAGKPSPPEVIRFALPTAQCLIPHTFPVTGIDNWTIVERLRNIFGRLEAKT